MGSFYKGFPWEIFFPRKSFVKFFWNFKLESDFFPHFFLQNQKTRKFRKFIYLELQLSQFSAKSAKKNLTKFLKFSEFSKLESDFSPHFLSKIRKLENSANIILSEVYLSKFWARSDKYGTQDFYMGFLWETFYKGISL